jgi:hypothetical protein
VGKLLIHSTTSQKQCTGFGTSIQVETKVVDAGEKCAKAVIEGIGRYVVAFMSLENLELWEVSMWRVG